MGGNDSTSVKPFVTHPVKACSFATAAPLTDRQITAVVLARKGVAGEFEGGATEKTALANGRRRARPR